MKPAPADSPVTIRPITGAEAQAHVALSWLETEDLPESVRAFFLKTVEELLERLVPREEWSTIKGSHDVSTYRAALLSAQSRRSGSY